MRAVNKQRPLPRILVHTDAAQAIGKIRVDACDMGVDYLTIVGHKVSPCYLFHHFLLSPTHHLNKTTCGRSHYANVLSLVTCFVSHI